MAKKYEELVISDDFMYVKVRDVRMNKKWRREYMKALLHDQDIRDEVTSKFEEIIADKDAEIADKDAEIERLKKLLLNREGI